MKAEKIRFFSEDISFKIKEKKKVDSWIRDVIKEENFRTGELNFIFCSDDYLLQINIEYLRHNTLTDIITFDQSDSPDIISGDIYISIDRIKENAETFKIPFDKELLRVIIHGVLHLCGYKDKTKSEQKEMRHKEDEYLGRLSMFHVKH